MGHTHYWKITNNLDTQRWKEFTEDVKIILDCSDIPIEVIHDQNMLRFNGVGEEDSYEDAYFSRSRGMEFCKTAQKPYDEVVCAVLLVAKDTWEDEIEISSDGNWEEWIDGRNLYRNAFPDRYPMNSPFKKNRY